MADLRFRLPNSKRATTTMTEPYSDDHLGIDKPMATTMTDAELDALVARQVDALRRLSSDVGGCFTYAEDAVREAIGNTNYSVIMQWVAESHKALDEAPDLIAALTTLRKQRDELREALESVAEWQDAALGHHSCALDMRTTARRALSNMEGE